MDFKTLLLEEEYPFLWIDALYQMSLSKAG